MTAAANGPAGNSIPITVPYAPDQRIAHRHASFTDLGTTANRLSIQHKRVDGMEPHPFDFDAER
jgi:hypothetical protein